MPAGIDGRVIEKLICPICDDGYERFKGVNKRTCSKLCGVRLRVRTMEEAGKVYNNKGWGKNKIRDEELQIIKQRRLDSQEHLKTIFGVEGTEGEII